MAEDPICDDRSLWQHQQETVICLSTFGWQCTSRREAHGSAALQIHYVGPCRRPAWTDPLLVNLPSNEETLHHPCQANNTTLEFRWSPSSAVGAGAGRWSAEGTFSFSNVVKSLCLCSLLLIFCLFRPSCVLLCKFFDLMHR